MLIDDADDLGDPGAARGNRILRNAILSNGDVTISPAMAVPAGQTITATATSSGGDTSEFSVPRTVVRP